MPDLVLSASQRVSLQKEIRTRLSVEDWSVVDATLAEFKVPAIKGFQGSIEDYILRRIGSSPDETLLELAQHVGFELDGVATPIAMPKFWQPGMFRLFLSHIHERKDFALALREGLKNLGITGFVAHVDIAPTTEWIEQIELALATADALVALLHPGFHESKWTDQEVGIAIGRRIPVASVRLGVDPYGFLGRIQAFGADESDPAKLATSILVAFRDHPRTKLRVAESLVSNFEASSSFASAKWRMGVLEGVQAWKPEFTERLRTAAKSNVDIREAFGVPSRVEALIRRWTKEE